MNCCEPATDADTLRIAVRILVEAYMDGYSVTPAVSFESKDGKRIAIYINATPKTCSEEDAE